MPTARKVVVDETQPGIYHTISRCVRRARLCGDGFEHRRTWLQKRLDFLASHMAIDIYEWDILDNHLHVLLGIRPDIVKGWSDKEAVRRYLTICPARWRRRLRGIPVDVPPTDQEIEDVLGIPGRVDVLRARMSSVSWFMAKLKEPVARRANLEDDCTGHFWEGRFRCLAVLDEAALLAVSTYISLNALRAGMIEKIEDSTHGSIGERVRMLTGAKRRTSVALAPIPGFSNKQYVAHVDRWSRLLVPGARSTPRRLPPILERLGLTPKSFGTWLKRSLHRAVGTAIGTAQSLQDEAHRRGGSWLKTPLAPVPS